MTSGASTAQKNEVYKPIVQSSSLNDLEIENFNSLIEVVCSKTHVFKIV